MFLFFLFFCFNFNSYGYIHKEISYKTMATQEVDLNHPLGFVLFEQMCVEGSYHLANPRRKY